MRLLISYLAIFVGRCDFSDMPNLVLQRSYQALVYVFEATITHDHDLIPRVGSAQQAFNNLLRIFFYLD